MGVDWRRRDRGYLCESDFAPLKTGHPPNQLVIVMEATGVYWMRFAENVYKAGFAVSVVNLMEVKRFAQVSLKRDKSALIDAQIITRFAITLATRLSFSLLFGSR